MKRFFRIYTLALLLMLTAVGDALFFMLSPFGGRAVAQPKCRLQTFTMSDGLPSGTITRCATDPQGMLWIATWNGLCNYDGYRINSFAAQHGEEQVLTSNRLRSIEPMGDGNVWLKTFDDKEYLFCGKEGRYYEAPLGSPEQGENNSGLPVTSSPRSGGHGGLFLHPDSLGIIHHTDLDGTHWQLLPNGTFGYLDPESKAFVPALTGMNMQKIIADKRGNLWFTGAHNLSMLSFRNYSFHQKPIVATSETRSVEADGKGHIFVGKRSGHIAMLNTDGNILGFISPSGFLVQTETPFCNVGIYALYHDRHGNLWIGTRGAGLYKLNLQTFALQKMTQHTDIFNINEDLQGRIWIGTYKEGCTIITPEGTVLARLDLPEGNARKVRRIERGQGDMMILSTADGLFTLSSNFKSPKDIRLHRTEYKPGEQTALLAKDVLHAIHNRKDNTLLISTMGGGLQTSLAPINGLAPGLGNVQALRQDEDNRVWVIGENTIRCLTYAAGGQSAQGSSQPSSLQETAVYGSNDWGDEVEFSEARTALDPQTGNIYVATSNGIIFFNPNKIKSSDFVPSLVFSGVQYQGDERITPLAGCERLLLPTDRHNAVVYFSALDYGNNELIRYAWRICELDTAWSYVGKEHCAPLSNLPPGVFTLEVRSTNSDGRWVGNNVTLLIDVEPTFWQSGWAWIIYLAVIAAILYTIYYIIRLRNEAKIEREMAEQKLRFYTDVKTQLRTPLTLIGAPVTEVLQTEKLSEQGRSILEFAERNASDMISILDKETQTAKPDPFTTDLTDFIEKNLQNEDLKIDDIASALCMSRSVLYNKVKTVYDISPMELLRDMRIKRACQLLTENYSMNISEIAYAIGFSEPKYFARIFKQRVGLTPSDYRKTTAATKKE